MDIPPDHHRKLVAEASVYVLALVENSVSAGHIRLMEAASTMTPVVATSVIGLADYVEPNVSALVVNPGDAIGLRNAVDQLLANEQLRQKLTERAIEMFGSTSMENYVAEIVAFVSDVDATVDRRGRARNAN